MRASRTSLVSNLVARRRSVLPQGTTQTVCFCITQAVYFMLNLHYTVRIMPSCLPSDHLFVSAFIHPFQNAVASQIMQRSSMMYDCTRSFRGGAELVLHRVRRRAGAAAARRHNVINTCNGGSARRLVGSCNEVSTTLLHVSKHHSLALNFQHLSELVTIAPGYGGPLQTPFGLIAKRK